MIDCGWREVSLNRLNLEGDHNCFGAARAKQLGVRSGVKMDGKLA